jgi:hypothetical protein
LYVVREACDAQAPVPLLLPGGVRRGRDEHLLGRTLEERERGEGLPQLGLEVPMLPHEGLEIRRLAPVAARLPGGQDLADLRPGLHVRVSGGSGRFRASAATARP